MCCLLNINLLKQPLKKCSLCMCLSPFVFSLFFMVTGDSKIINKPTYTWMIFAKYFFDTWVYVQWRTCDFFNSHNKNDLNAERITTTEKRTKRDTTAFHPIHSTSTQCFIVNAFKFSSSGNSSSSSKIAYCIYVCNGQTHEGCFTNIVYAMECGAWIFFFCVTVILLTVAQLHACITCHSMLGIERKSRFGYFFSIFFFISHSLNGVFFLFLTGWNGNFVSENAHNRTSEMSSSALVLWKTNDKFRSLISNEASQCWKCDWNK